MSGKQRDTLGLPLSRRHSDLLHGTSYTVSEAVAEFIETEGKASATLADTIKRLMRNEVGRPAALDLLRCGHDKKSGQPSNCSVCALKWRRWIVPQVIAFQQKNVKSTIVTLLLREVPEGELDRISLSPERDALRKRLQRCDFQACIGNIEVAFKPERRTWSVHAHLLVFGPSDGPCALLRKKSPLPRSVHLQTISAPRRVRQITYLFKFVTYYLHPSSPRPLPLPDQQLAELARWRMKFRLADYLLLLGFQRRGHILPGLAFKRLLRRSQASGDMATWRRLVIASSHTPPHPKTSVRRR